MLRRRAKRGNVSGCCRKCLPLALLLACGRNTVTVGGEPAEPMGAAGAAPSKGPGPTRPTVGLDGSFRNPLALDGASRIYARVLRTWIHEQPRAGAPKLGTLRAGMSLATKGGRHGNDGCPGGWHAVEPQGFVCAGAEATLDASDALVRVFSEYPAQMAQPLPFIYGTVRRPGPIYRRLPTSSELGQTEPDLKERIEKWLSLPGETGATYAQHVWTGSQSGAPDPTFAWNSQQTDPVPWFLEAGKTPPKLVGRAAPEHPFLFGRMEPRVGYSILRTMLWNGRRYALTSDLGLVPTDRLRPIQGSKFHGYRIPEDIDFPFAIIRKPGARHYRYDRDKRRLSPADPADFRAAVRLTGKQNFFRGRLHYETTNDTWLSDSDASRLDPARRMPAWGKNGEKWIDINVTKQTLVLYEGSTAVYATLVSTGEAGLDDAESTTATQRGIFRIHTKFVTATMDSDVVGEEFELRDVPYVQYFEKGYALHGAYWHDRFGTPKSHGCINLAPEDARRIFFWTEPALPPGWYSVLKPLRGTVLFVHP